MIKSHWAGVVAASFCLMISGTATATELFFTHNSSYTHRIASVDASGGSVQTVYGGLGDPFGVDVDVTTGLVYWTDALTESVLRASADGSGPIEALITEGLFDPHDIAVDPFGDKLYFADRRNSQMKRANLDGSDLEVLFSLTLPTYVELDLVNEHLYFVFGAGGSPSIGRSNLDGTGFETVLTDSSPIHGIAIDPLAGRIYFSVRNTAEIRRADLDGTNAVTLVAGLDAVALDLALDATTGTLYWSQYNGVRSMPASGGSIDTVVSGLQGLSAINGVNGISLGMHPVPEPSTAVLLGLSIVGLAARRRGPHH